MPNKILELIRDNVEIKTIQQYVAVHPKPPLFTPLSELKNRTLYDHLKRYGKLYNWSLEDFISNKIINFQEVDANGNNLMHHIIKRNDLRIFQYLLMAGEKPTEEILLASQGTSIGDFLNYQPGRNNPTVYKLATKRNPDINKLIDLMFDFYETTDDDSTDAEISDLEALDSRDFQAYKVSQTQAINAYNQTGRDVDKIRLVAARGVHFIKDHFPKETRKLIRDTRKKNHTTYSASTLFDSGYEADDEPEETDNNIRKTHLRNLQFIETLKTTPDRKEKKTGHRNPPACRNKKVFENLFWREIQVYINSYDTLFNLNSIQINFSFASNKNPHLSLSWKSDVAGMYAGGVRFDWKKGQRRDPHYRRYDGKPKHPNLGYIDVFAFPVDYARVNGVDRLLAYNNKHIDLSNIHLSEAEVIFHSIIPKEFHISRHMVVLPSFERVAYQKDSDEKYFGMKGSGSYTRARNDFFKTTKGKKKDENYQKWVTSRTKQAVQAQSTLIDKSTDARLFKIGKARAFDHGHSIEDTLPSPQR